MVVVSAGLGMIVAASGFAPSVVAATSLFVMALLVGAAQQALP